jgi:hypothetical protein
LILYFVYYASLGTLIFFVQYFKIKVRIPVFLGETCNLYILVKFGKVSECVNYAIIDINQFTSSDCFNLEVVKCIATVYLNQLVLKEEV